MLEAAGGGRTRRWSSETCSRFLSRSESKLVLMPLSPSLRSLKRRARSAREYYVKTTFTINEEVIR